MKVRCVRSFAGTDGDGNQVSYGMGDVFDLPQGVDWLTAGLVEPVEIQQETATRAKPKRRGRGKRGPSS